MRTIAYIDGYNLYYGCLRHTPYKWLDVVSLCYRLINAQDPSAELIKVKFFTAPIMARFSRHGRKGDAAQKSYHRALETLHSTETLAIIKGRHISEPTSLPLDQVPFALNDRVNVLRIEEKLTDVNIASHMIEDAVIEARCQQIVLFTSDTDLTPALEVIRRHKPHTRIGLILPRREAAKTRSADDANHTRPPNNKLSNLADWTRDTIRNKELADAQMPERVPAKKKVFF